MHSGLTFRQSFVNGSLFCCMVALTPELLEWNHSSLFEERWAYLLKRAHSPAWRIQVWRVVIETQVSSEVVPFQPSKFCDRLATNNLPCSVSLGVSFWTSQYSVYSSSEWEMETYFPPAWEYFISPPLSALKSCQQKWVERCIQKKSSIFFLCSIKQNGNNRMCWI